MTMNQTTRHLFCMEGWGAARMALVRHLMALLLHLAKSATASTHCFREENGLTGLVHF